MSAALPRWLFTRDDSGSWTWQRDSGVRSATFPNLKQATDDASRHGFDSQNHYWTAINDGRMTYYRPGKTATEPAIRRSPEALTDQVIAESAALASNRYFRLCSSRLASISLNAGVFTFFQTSERPA